MLEIAPDVYKLFLKGSPEALSEAYRRSLYYLIGFDHYYHHDAVPELFDLKFDEIEGYRMISFTSKCSSFTPDFFQIPGLQQIWFFHGGCGNTGSTNDVNSEILNRKEVFGIPDVDYTVFTNEKAGYDYETPEFVDLGKAIIESPDEYTLVSRIFSTEMVIIEVESCPPPIGEYGWKKVTDSIFSCSPSQYDYISLHEYIERNKSYKILFRIVCREKGYMPGTGEIIKVKAFINDVDFKYFRESYHCTFGLHSECFSFSKDEGVKSIIELEKHLNHLTHDDPSTIPSPELITITPIKRIKSINELPI